MSLLVEDGTGIVAAESYCSAVDCADYAVKNGAAFSTTDLAAAEAALRRGSAYVDTYRAQFPGYRAHRRAQGLEWPRIGAYYSWGDESDYADYIGNNVIPIEVIRATCEAAVRELAEPGSMQPDLDRGGAIQELQAGSVRIVYAANATAGTSTQIIDSILAPLLRSGSAGGLFGTAVRS